MLHLQGGTDWLTQQRLKTILRIHTGNYSFVGKLGSRNKCDLGNIHGWNSPTSLTGFIHWDRILAHHQSYIFVNLSFLNASQANLSEVALWNMNGNQGSFHLQAMKHYLFIIKGETETHGGCSSPQPRFMWDESWPESPHGRVQCHVGHPPPLWASMQREHNSGLKPQPGWEGFLNCWAQHQNKEIYHFPGSSWA